jgi:hypothetical protein
MDRITVLFKRFQPAGLLSVAAWTLIAASSPAVAATVVTYTDVAAFQSAIQPGYYLENFDSLTPGQTLDPITWDIVPMSFSSLDGAFSYTADAPGDSIFIVQDPNNLSAQSLSTNSPGFDMIITFASGIRAVGGNFFATDISGYVSSGLVTITLGDGTTQTLTDPLGTDFGGFTSIDSDISSLTISAAPDPLQDPLLTPVYGTVDNFYAGTVTPTAPEPQSIFLLLGGLTAGGVLQLRRRRNT